MTNSKVFWFLFIVLLSRTILALFAQTVFSWGSSFIGTPMSLLEAGRWWTVYGSIVDIGCFALMVWILKREGTEMNTFIGFSRTRVKSDVIHAGLLFMAIIPLTALWGSLVSYLIYGQPTSPILAGPLPLWGKLYSIFVWPIGWAVMEQMIYIGYCLPKLVNALRNKFAAVFIVMFFWALQHTVLPLTLDNDYSLYRFLTVIPMVIIPIYYLRTRRLIPLILVHAFSDCISAVSFYFLPIG